jgi:hypothetical protein
MIRMISLTLVVCVVSVLVLSCSSGSTSVDPVFQNLPVGWKVERADTATPSQTSEISAKLGVPIERLSNNHLVVDGQRIQINILETATAEDAARLHEAIAKMKDPAACRLKGLKVYEFVGDASVTMEFVNKVSEQLGI